MSVLEATLEDSGYLQKIAEEKLKARTRPTDVALIVITVMALVAAAVWTLPIIDTGRYSVDGSRWVMAAACVLSAIAATAAGVYVLDRRSKRRADELMAHLETLRPVACHNASALGQLAAQVEQLDQRIGRLVAVVDPEPAQVPSAQVHEMTAEAYRLGRRSRPAGND